MSYNFEIGKVYTFEPLSPVFLGRTITRAKLKSIVDASTARMFSPIDQLHAQIYPTLPAGTPASANSSIYYVFEVENGTLAVMAESWIDLSSIEVIEYVDITVKVARASLQDVEKVRRILSLGGIKDFVLSTD